MSFLPSGFSTLPCMSIFLSSWFLQQHCQNTQLQRSPTPWLQQKVHQPFLFIVDGWMRKVHQSDTATVLAL
jgi:hypothetical protein